MSKWSWWRPGRLRLGRLPVVRRVPPGRRPRRSTATPHARLRRYRHLPGLVPRPSRGGHRHSGRLVRLWLSPLGGGQAGKMEAVPPRAVTTPFSRSAGMSGNLVVAALYDREGSLWSGRRPGSTVPRDQLTPIVPPGYLEAAGVAPDTNGIVWIAARRGTPAALLTVGDRIAPRLDAPAMLTCIFRDLRGGLWIGGGGLWERKGDAFAPVPLPPVTPGGSASGARSRR